MKDFIDAYKHLEKRCSEIYGEQHGLSQYISDMEMTPSYISGSIPGFASDLKELKRLRHIRNALVHDDSEPPVEYSQNDIDYLNEFHDRIMNRKDPLSIWNDRQRMFEDPAPGSHEMPYVNWKPDGKNCRKNTKTLAVLAICAILLVYAIIMILIWKL